MRIEQSNAFARRVKKLHATEKKALDKAIKAIVSTPSVGKMKVGDLASVRELNEMVNERVYVAKVEGEKIDFTNFPEYSELQNLYSDMTYKL